MLSTNFFLIKTEKGDTIQDERSKLRINIYNIGSGLFQPNPSELQFYGIYEDKCVAFETVEIRDFLRPQVASALMWYAQYIGYPEMNISSENPIHSRKVG